MTIQNVGTQPTTLTNYGFFQYATKQDRKCRKPETMAVLANYEGDHYPHKLGVGEEAQILFEQDLALDRALKKKIVYFAVWHSFDQHPVETPISRPIKE